MGVRTGVFAGFQFEIVQIESATFNLHTNNGVSSCKLKVLLSICMAFRYNRRHDQA